MPNINRYPTGNDPMTDARPAPATESLKKLVRESRHLRDHLMRLEGHDSMPLARALNPFDRDEPDQVTEADVTALSHAFQESFDGALGAVDGRTLDNILSGYSPHLRPDSTFASLGLAMIGFLLVVGTFHFTFWANRTTSIMEQSEEFVAFNHFEQMMKIVELDNYFAATNATAPSSTADLEPQLVYLEQLSRLETEYHHERTLPSRMNELLVGFNPLGIVRDRIQRRICQPGIFETTPTLAAVIGCPFSLQVSDDSEVEEDANVDANTDAANSTDSGDADEVQVSMSQTDLLSLNGFDGGLGHIDAIREKTMKAAGRDFYGTYTRSQRVVEGLQQRLREQLNIVHLWALPILYGALGSIVYCMWRVLNPNVSGLGFVHPVMRTIIAGLAALTFSMLLVPSNILTVGVDLNRPLIYLLSFVFGYSIEAFINTLNVLNTYVSGSIAVKGKRPS